MTTLYTITIHNEQLPVLIRRHKRSRSMVIRYQPLQHALSLTLPRYVSIRQGLHFIEEKRGWIERQLREHVRHIPLSDGQLIPMLGQDYTLVHVGGRGVIAADGARILVPGDASFYEAPRARMAEGKNPRRNHCAGGGEGEKNRQKTGKNYPAGHQLALGKL